MATVARDLDHVLVAGVAAMIAAIIRIACDRTNTHFMFTFSFVCHSLIPLIYAAKCYTRESFPAFLTVGNRDIDIYFFLLCSRNTAVKY